MEKLSLPQRQDNFQRQNSTNLITEIKNIQNISLDSLGNKLIHYASMKHHSDLRGIILLGGDLQAKDKEDNTPLHRAALGGSVKAVEDLLLLGANKMAANCHGNTPIHVAQSSRTKQAKKIIQLLQK